MSELQIQDLVMEHLLKAGEADKAEGFLFGVYKSEPRSKGVFFRNGGWFVYDVNEHGYAAISGPFTLEEAAYAVGLLLGVSEAFLGIPFSEKARETYIHTQYRSLYEVDQATGKSGKMQEAARDAFLPSEEVNQLLLDAVARHIKVPHSTSYPVIRRTAKGLCFAAYTFFYTKDEIQAGQVRRPLSWITADLISGSPLAMYDCKKLDFSDADFETRYDIHAQGSYDRSEAYYGQAFAILDSVRRRIFEEKKFYDVEYRAYLNRILANIPSAYRRFYEELSI